MESISTIQDHTGATPSIAGLVQDYQESKSRHDVEGTISFLSPVNFAYTHAVYGTVSSRQAVHDFMAQAMPNWGNGVPYATTGLDEHGHTGRMRSVWDGAMIADQTLSTLVLAALEPSDN